MPPVVPKKLRVISDVYGIFKQIKFLSRFMGHLVRDSLLKTSPHFLSFLSETEEKVFRTVKRDSVKKPLNVKELYSVSGKIVCDPSLHSEEDTHFAVYLNQIETQRNSLKKLCKTLVGKIKETGLVLTEVSTAVEALEKTSRMLRAFPQSVSMLDSVRTVFKEWAHLQKETADLLVEKIYTIIKYNTKDLEPLNELQQAKNNKFASFSKMNVKLIAKKEKLWNNKDISTWGTCILEENDSKELYNNKELAFSQMLSLETDEVSKLRDEYSYFNHQLKHESAKLLKTNFNEEVTSFAEFSKKMSEVMTKMHLAFGELLATASEIEYTRSIDK